MKQSPSPSLVNPESVPMHPTRLSSVATPTLTNSGEPTGESTARQNDEARSMTVRVNDKSMAVADTTMLSQLFDELGLTGRQGIAVAVNDTVVFRPDWPTHRLADGDQVLVIQATQGG